VATAASRLQCDFEVAVERGLQRQRPRTRPAGEAAAHRPRGPRRPRPEHVGTHGGERLWARPEARVDHLPRKGERAAVELRRGAVRLRERLARVK
jgi:hypothetical protein